jgi:hypothetical protein
MSKTALTDAIRSFDLEAVKSILRNKPGLKQLMLDSGFNLLQFCCARCTVGDRAAADRQVQLARWLVSEGFDPKETYLSAAGEDGNEEPAGVSLVWFAVARAQDDRLARYFLKKGAAPGALFAAAWWGNADIIPDLVRHGADLNEPVGGGTPFHMAVDVLKRGVERKPELARQRTKVLKEMLRLGADPNIPAGNGTTVLHIALEKDYGIETFKLLLKYGADPDVPGKDGRTVRDIASRKRDRRYFEELPQR